MIDKTIAGDTQVSLEFHCHPHQRGQVDRTPLIGSLEDDQPAIELVEKATATEIAGACAEFYHAAIRKLPVWASREALYLPTASFDRSTGGMTGAPSSEMDFRMVADLA